MRPATEGEVDRGEADWCAVCNADCENRGKDFLCKCERFKKEAAR